MWYSLTTVKNSDGSFTFTTCSPNGEQGYYGGYFYVLTPSGKQLGKVDIPKGGCRPDTIAASYFTESGKYIAKVSDYNGFVWEEQDIYPTAPYFGYVPPVITYLSFFRNNRYNSSLGVYKYGYIENGSSEDSLTDSFVPEGATTEQIIRNHILPAKNWASATYNTQTYYIGTANPSFLDEVPNRPLICGSLGDVLGDGQIGMDDALAVVQYTVGARTLTQTQLAAADVNGDGQVNIVDALFIAQYTIGTRTTFPVCSGAAGKPDSRLETALLLGVGILVAALIFKKR